jgi:hypothetical protein
MQRITCYYPSGVIMSIRAYFDARRKPEELLNDIKAGYIRPDEHCDKIKFRSRRQYRVAYRDIDGQWRLE